MRKNLFAALTMASMISVSACGPKYDQPVEASQTGFAISLLQNVDAVTPDNENVIVSPYSAAVALSMLSEVFCIRRKTLAAVRMWS